MIIKNLNESLKNGKEIKNHDKKKLSDYQEFIPMYDIYSESIILVKNKDLFNKMKNYHYRFIDNRLFIWLKNKLEKLKSKKDNNYDDNLKLKRLEQGVKFLKNYDINKLYNNSIETMYSYSPEIGLDITICKRKSFISFFPHLKPYYSKDELINLGLNMNAIKNVNKEILFDGEKHYQICKLISNNDVNKELILDHTKYINNSDAKYLIQYYSLYGSYFINKFLRNYIQVKNNKIIYDKDNLTKSSLVHNITSKLVKVVNNSPPLDNDYILYRFVTDDSYLNKIKVGEHFIETGFMSTTRDPFYSNKQEIEFGFILMKIRLPKGKKGVALNIELYSHFKNEQEFILPPLSKFKLISKNDNFNYYHIDKEFEIKIKKKYEFEYIETLPNIKFDKYISLVDNLEVDFLNVELKGDEILNRIDYFIKNFTNQINEFKSTIGDQQFKFNIHWYDSTGPYKKFYYIKLELGFSIVLYDENGKVLLLIEISDLISVNYYLKFVDNDNKIIKDDDLIEFISKIAYCFKINNCIIHTDYSSFNKFKNNYQDELIINSLDCFSYPLDYYNYLKNGIKRFSKINSIYSKFNYFELDFLKKKTLKDIYDKEQINIILEGKKINFKNLSEFYIYIVENKFYLVKRFIKDLKKIYNLNNNPFLSKYYYLEANSYLYNKGLIKYIPVVNSKTEDELQEKFVDLDEYQNLYRKGYRN